MTTLEQLAGKSVPDWLVAEMPPGYQNRVAEIRRLYDDLHAMARFGGLLHGVGSELAEIVNELFLSLKLDSQLIPDASGTGIAVKLDGRRRLLIQVSSDTGPVQKKSPELARVFQMLHELADDADRVVLVANSDPKTRPADRPASATPDALAFLHRLGANLLPSPTLFTLWTLSLQDPARARSVLDGVHKQDGGIFLLPASVTL